MCVCETIMYMIADSFFVRLCVCVTLFGAKYHWFEGRATVHYPRRRPRATGGHNGRPPLSLLLAPSLHPMRPVTKLTVKQPSPSHTTVSRYELEESERERERESTSACSASTVARNF